MKGIILFDNLNDIAFFDVDEALSNHIKKLALKDGLLEVTTKSSTSLQTKNVNR